MPAREVAMSRHEFNRSLRLLGKTPYAMAPLIGVSLRQSHRYASGETGVPVSVAIILRQLVEKHRLNEKRTPP